MKLPVASIHKGLIIPNATVEYLRGQQIVNIDDADGLSSVSVVAIVSVDTTIPSGSVMINPATVLSSDADLTISGSLLTYHSEISGSGNLIGAGDIL